MQSSKLLKPHVQYQENLLPKLTPKPEEKTTSTNLITCTSMVISVSLKNIKA